MPNDEYDIDPKSHKALISLAEDKGELYYMDHNLQILGNEVTDQVFDDCEHSQYSSHPNKNTITHHLQVEPQQLAKITECNQQELNDNSICNARVKDFYTDKQYSNLHNINISEASNNNYDIILEDDTKSSLPEQTVLYIMNLMSNNIYPRLINCCNNTLNIVKKHKVKVFNSQDIENIENNVEQFKISRNNINVEFNQQIIEQKSVTKNIHELLKNHPELLFTQIIDLQNSLKEFELLFGNLYSLNCAREGLHKCINSINTLLHSLKEFALPFSNLQDLHGTIERLQKCIECIKSTDPLLHSLEKFELPFSDLQNLNCAMEELQKCINSIDTLLYSLKEFKRSFSDLQDLHDIRETLQKCIESIDTLRYPLKEFELLFNDLQDLHDIRETLQKCINSANTLLLSNIEQVELKNTKKPFDRLMTTIAVINMLCDSLYRQDIAGANPQYFMDLRTKSNKIMKGLYINDLARNMCLDFSSKYSQVVNSIFNNNTLYLNALDKIQTNIRNYTRGTSDLNQNTAANSDIRFLFAGTKFIIEKIDAMIESYIKLHGINGIICNNTTTKQQDKNPHDTIKHDSINNTDIYDISTRHNTHNKPLSSNTKPSKDQNPINTYNSEIDNVSLRTRTKRNTDTIIDTSSLSKESSLTNIVVDINNDSNNTSTNAENENLTHNITQDAPNNLRNKVNAAAKTNIQTTFAEQEIEHDHKEHVANRATTNIKANYLASTNRQSQKVMVTAKSASVAKEPRVNTSAAPKEYKNFYSYSIPLADIAAWPDTVTTGTFTSITHKHKINSTRTVQLNDKDATYRSYNIKHGNNSRTYYLPTAYQLVVNTMPVVNIYNEASITYNTTNTFGIEYNVKTLNNNVNHMEYVVGHRSPISNNLANNNMQPDNLTLYNYIATLQYQLLYYNITLPSNIVCYPKLLNLSNFVRSYKSQQDKEEIFEKRACDKIIIDHTGYNTRKDHHSFLEALNYGHKMFAIILARTNTYKELHKQYPSKSIKELLLTSSLINNLDADEKQNLTSIYMNIAANILGSSQNTKYTQRTSFAAKLQPLIFKCDVENPKQQIAYGIDGLVIDMQDSKLQIDNIEQDVTLRTASIPTYIDPKLGVTSISLAFTDSFGRIPLESEALYITIHYDNTGNIVASHYPPIMQFIGKRPVIRTLKGSYFGPCTQDVIQQLEKHISINASHNRALNTSRYENRRYGS